ncbi:MAG: hypothetical protein ACK47M_19085, partial [Caldilinea sp.]
MKVCALGFRLVVIMIVIIIVSVIMVVGIAMPVTVIMSVIMSVHIEHRRGSRRCADQRAVVALGALK